MKLTLEIDMPPSRVRSAGAWRQAVADAADFLRERVELVAVEDPYPYVATRRGEANITVEVEV